MSPQPASRRMENLAFVFQELLTVGERLRSNRQQVSDAASFRAQIWGAVKLADDEARRRGYTAEDIELAIFAVVAFLDESILNLRLRSEERRVGKEWRARRTEQRRQTAIIRRRS